MSGLTRWKILVPAVAAMCMAAGASNAQVSSPGAGEAVLGRQLHAGGRSHASTPACGGSMAAIFTDSLIRFRQEGYTPRRDIKLALTCGEETAGAGLFDSVRWLVQTQPEVLAAEFAINEGAGGEYDRNGKPIVLQVVAGEKVYQDFTLEVSDPGGHSSLPKAGPTCVRAIEQFLHLVSEVAQLMVAADA
jgi:acetylornithine deacetylase/succinyl-diaminopimelate desuccinylase-like protein